MTEQLFAFIEKSVSCFHAVETIRTELEKEGFAELKENEEWNPASGGKYYVIRNGSSIAAVTPKIGAVTNG